ncbi:hypothetical protein OROMI_009343 [Orobanche minor]
MSNVAAISVLRSTATTARISAVKLNGGVKPRTAPSPFRISSQKPLSARIFRSPIEMSSISVVSMLPYHSATASAVLTSMLSVAPLGHGWSIEEMGIGDDGLEVESLGVEKAKGVKKKEDDDVKETGHCIMLRFLCCCFISRTKVDSSTSGISTPVGKIKYLKEHDSAVPFAFVDPTSVPGDGDMSGNGRLLIERLTDTTVDSIFLIPFNTWTSVVRAFNASKGKKTVPTFKQLTNNDLGHFECGFCVCRYMKEIIESDDPNLEKIYGGGPVRDKYYSQAQYDEVLDDWSQFVYSHLI